MAIANTENTVNIANAIFSVSFKIIGKMLQPLTPEKRIAHESAAFGLSATDASKTIL